MSENTQSPAKIINFVKIKSWYIPADATSYQLLVAIKAPLLKIHQDFLPTLQLSTKAHGLRAKSVPFADLIGDFLDRIGSVWGANPKRKCKLTEQRSSFSCPSTPKNRRAITRLDVLFQEFTSRWGFCYTPVFSETHKDLKLVLDYKFDPTKNPIIPAVEAVPEPVFELILGFTKVKVTFDVRRVSSLTRARGAARMEAPSHVGAPTHILEIYTKAGVEWVQVHTASFTHHQIGDMAPFLGCLGQLHAQQRTIPT